MPICSASFKFSYILLFSLTWWDFHIGVKSNGIMSLKFCKILEYNSQKLFCTPTWPPWRQMKTKFLEPSCDKLNCTLYFRFNNWFRFLSLFAVVLGLLLLRYKIKIWDYSKTFLIRLFVIFMQITQFLGKLSPETNSGIFPESLTIRGKALPTLVCISH